MPVTMLEVGRLLAVLELRPLLNQQFDEAGLLGKKRQKYRTSLFLRTVFFVYSVSMRAKESRFGVSLAEAPSWSRYWQPWRHLRRLVSYTSASATGRAGAE